MCAGVMYVMHRSNTVRMYIYFTNRPHLSALPAYTSTTYKTDVVKPSQAAAVAFFLIELVNLKQ